MSNSFWPAFPMDDSNNITDTLNFTAPINLNSTLFLYPPGCKQYQPRNGTNTQALVNLISYCYVLPTVCALGILGNTANLMTLASKSLKAVSYMYLRGLGIADMLCMLFVLLFVSFEIISSSPTYRHFLTSYEVVWFRSHLMLPLINFPVSAGILIVLALTLERYISIAWPILFREWNSPRRARLIMMAAYVFSFMLYIPMCWQHDVIPICVTLTTDDETDGNETNYYNLRSNLQWTSVDNGILSKSKGYMVYKYTREGILKVVPIVALTFLNLQIIIAFKKVRRRRRRLNTNTSQSTREQKSLLFLLAGIVVLFFICNIPAAINLIFISDAMKKETSFVIFRAVANLLEITNHALNFYNFCLCSTDYRQTFLRTFPCVKRMQESAEDIKRRVSNSMARVQAASRATSIVINNHNHHSQYVETEVQTTLTVTHSLKSMNGTSDRPPLRRALSSDALLRLNHCPLKDKNGRRFGHHYVAGTGRRSMRTQHPTTAPMQTHLHRRLSIRDTGGGHIGYKRCDSVHDILEQPILEGGGGAGAGGEYENLNYYSPNGSRTNSKLNSVRLRISASPKIASSFNLIVNDTTISSCPSQDASTLALVDFESGSMMSTTAGEEKSRILSSLSKSDMIHDSSLTYISTDYAIIITDNDEDEDDNDEKVEERRTTSKKRWSGRRRRESSGSDDTSLSYSSANDVYL